MVGVLHRSLLRSYPASFPFNQNVPQFLHETSRHSNNIYIFIWIVWTGVLHRSLFGSYHASSPLSTYLPFTSSRSILLRFCYHGRLLLVLKNLPEIPNYRRFSFELVGEFSTFGRLTLDEIHVNTNQRSKRSHRRSRIHTHRVPYYSYFLLQLLRCHTLVSSVFSLYAFLNGVRISGVA